jgi:hypothetical protein
MAEKLWPGKPIRSVHTLVWPEGARRVDRPGYLPEEWEEYIPYIAREMLEVSPAIPTYGYHCGSFYPCPYNKDCMRKLKTGVDESEGVIPNWMQISKETFD